MTEADDTRFPDTLDDALISLQDSSAADPDLVKKVGAVRESSV